ncbi:uncharacterized protein LOC116216059 [Punica granatum]|uniref:Uncharacterized protein n=2 Tax=Punica granatum TaxID=22663 RepID=A0A218XDG2_PUNGR|nr:uncharacterized protein LOC116216059 [Punica granatum]OWM82987.1 hypothetical protein CDL15_Pgr005387 [Punica granatum]PKI77829.1 hypothetical protein CRG98_001793 [Punica granatum]
MASFPLGSSSCGVSCKHAASSVIAASALPTPLQPNGRTVKNLVGERISLRSSRRGSMGGMAERVIFTVSRIRCYSDAGNSAEESPDQGKIPFGNTRKDVLLIGLGVTVLGIGLKSGLEFVGVDPLQAGNVVQLLLVLGLTLGWISTYIFRVSNKEMTYAQQLRDYEKKVMEKRLESLSEAELEALLEQVEEEKRRLASGEQVN